MKCHICNSKISEIKKFKKYYLVSSDCKPTFYTGQLGICIKCKTIQKPINSLWKKRVKKIYNHYEMFSQSLGEDQKLFNEKKINQINRSTQIVNLIKKNTQISKVGNLLDIGCGTGPFIKSFGSLYPKWNLYGFEQDQKFNKYLKGISSFKKLYSQDLDQIKIKFDLIVLIHTLEHIVDPINFLIKIRSLLTPKGKLFIEVPDFDKSPFDILVADHSSHFVKQNINYIAYNAGYKKIFCKSDIIPKEISSIYEISNKLINSKKNIPNINIARQKNKINNYFNFYNNFISILKSYKKAICIFGTSIAATWLGQSIDNDYIFTDEDKTRINKNHMGKKIHSLSSVPKTIKIILPFRSDISTKIIKRVFRDKKDFILISK